MIHVCGVGASEKSAEIRFRITKILKIFILDVYDNPLITADILKVHTVEHQRTYKEDVSRFHFKNVRLDHEVDVAIKEKNYLVAVMVMNGADIGFIHAGPLVLADDLAVDHCIREVQTLFHTPPYNTGKDIVHFISDNAKNILLFVYLF